MWKMIILVSTLLLPACATTTAPKLTEEEQKIKVIRGSFTLDGCTLKAALREEIPYYWGSDSYYKDHAGDALRRAALPFGANTVVVVQAGSPGEYAWGNAYYCK